MKNINKIFIIFILWCFFLIPICNASESCKSVYDKDYIKNGKMDGRVVYFYPLGFKCEVNLRYNVAIPDQKLHLFFMGTDGNFSLESCGENRYIIHSIAEMGKFDFIVGARNNLKSKEGDKVVLNSIGCNIDNRNVWEFTKNDKGKGYKIRNQKTGLYLSLKNINKDDSGNYLVLRKDPIYWEIVCYDDDFSIPWMSMIPSGRLLSQINIPGSHDTGTRLVDGQLPQISLCQCQCLSPSEQLNAGVRMFDLRCNVRDNPKDPFITHTFPCFDGLGDMMYLSEIFESAEKFLKKNPSETIIFLVSVGKDLVQQGTNRQIEEVISNYIKSGRLWSKTYVPKLGEVRGKIVLMRRFGVSGNNQNNIKKDNFGFDMTAWEKGERYASYKGLIKLKSGARAWIQDNYICNGKTKIEYFKPSLMEANDANKISADEFVFNYMSCIKGGPINAARIVNKEIFTKGIINKGNRYGIIPIDYVTFPIARQIYESNF